MVIEKQMEMLTSQHMFVASFSQAKPKSSEFMYSTDQLNYQLTTLAIWRVQTISHNFADRPDLPSPLTATHLPFQVGITTLYIFSLHYNAIFGWNWSAYVGLGKTQLVDRFPEALSAGKWIQHDTPKTPKAQSPEKNVPSGKLS